MDIIIGIIMAVMIVAVGTWIIIGSKRRRWYKVYLANNEILLLYRDFKERWWRTSDRYMRFKDEHGREVTFPSNAHWVLMWEDVRKDEIDVVRDELRRRKEELAERDRG